MKKPLTAEMTLYVEVADDRDRQAVYAFAFDHQLSLEWVPNTQDGNGHGAIRVYGEPQPAPTGSAWLEVHKLISG